MGQSQIEQKQKQQYKIIQQLSIGNIIKYNKSQSLCFIKQYSFTSQESYQNTLNIYSLKLSNKNQHILNLKNFTTKSQNSFCSTFYKIILIFQYLDYTLEKQIINRIKDNHPFNEKQIWSILCSTVLASVHLIHCQNRMHCGLTTKDIRLNSSGCVKLLHHQMIGIDSNHTTKEGLPKTLALTLIECMSLQKLSNEENSYLQKVIEGLQYSREMKDMLLMMIKKDIKFTQIEEHLFKLVQEDDSFTRNSSTPAHKGCSPNSNHKHTKSIKNEYNNNNARYSKIVQQKYQELVPSSCDYQDVKSYIFPMEIMQMEIEIPDQTEKQSNQQVEEEESGHKVDPFTIEMKKKEKKFDSSSKKSYRNKQNYQKQYPSSSKMQNNGSSSRQNKKQQHVFTDPKLFQLLRNGLEEMNMKISTGQLIKFNQNQQNGNINQNHNQNHNNNNNIVNNNNNINNNYTNKQCNSTTNYTQHFLIPITNNENIESGRKQKQKKTPQKNEMIRKEQKVLFINRNREESNQKNKLDSIQIIKQVSQEYREDDQYQNIKQMESIKIKQNNIERIENKNNEQKYILNEKNRQQHKIQNILNNNQIGFKKKKYYGKLQPQKQNNNILVQKKYNQQQNNQYLSKYIKSYKNNQQKNIQQKIKSFKNKLYQSKNINNNDVKFQIIDENLTKKNYSATTTTRIDKDKEEKNIEKLVQVNQKYNRGRYQGTKLNGKRQGYGTFYYSEGGRYIGNWKQNKMHGKGVLYYPNQQIAYDGQWQNDQLSGYGTLYNEEVTSLKIPFDYRDWSDVEDYWVKYQGYFSQDNKDGKGKLYLSNGERLEGQFHDDKVDGDGILYRGDGSSVKGKWRQNKLIRLF